MPVMPPIITLLTDFGSCDTYVGQMKGAILSVCLDARLVDLTHAIAPGDIPAAAIAWADAVGVFPAGTVHLAVVDPGVGSPRRAIAAEIGVWKFVCPDNGLLTQILKQWPLVQAVETTDRRWWRNDVSTVFHGRDVFGPVAGHWAAGREITDFGPLLTDSPVTLPGEEPIIDGGRIQGTVQSIDRFGNLVTNLPGAFFAEWNADWTIRIGPHEIHGLSPFYGSQPFGSLIAVIGSHGRLEIAVNQGDAAARLGATVGMIVEVEETRNKRQETISAW